jgi:hypothetical protein
MFPEFWIQLQELLKRLLNNKKTTVLFISLFFKATCLYNRLNLPKRYMISLCMLSNIQKIVIISFFPYVFNLNLHIFVKRQLF